MSYLSMPSLPGFSQAVISFWFKVPQESLDAADAGRTGEEGALFEGIVPLVVMGKEGTGNTPTHQEKTEDQLTFTSSGTTCSGGLVDITAACTGVVGFCCVSSVITFTYECNCFETSSESRGGITFHTSPTGPAPKTDPTYIGVGSDGYLYVNFESTKKPTVSNAFHERTGINPGSASGGQVGECSGGTKSFGCDVLCCVCLIIECSNSVDNGDGEDNTTPSPPEHPGTSTPTTYTYSEIPWREDASGAISSNNIEAKADEWHHVLISVDLKAVSSHSELGGTGPIGDYVDSASVLHIALDDKNYTKYDLSNNWAEGRGDNDIITRGAARVGGGYLTPSPEDQPQGEATYSVEMSVPEGDIGMPAIAKYVDNIYRVEMAEFQMWIGKTLDTKVEKNRRAFIDYKRDGEGKIIPEKDGTEKLKPVNPSKAEKLLGGKPSILLHGSGKWKKGNNTGSIDTDFKPTAKIEKYKPDPTVAKAEA